jgi:hypothetical protein
MRSVRSTCGIPAVRAAQSIMPSVTVRHWTIGDQRLSAAAALVETDPRLWSERA